MNVYERRVLRILGAADMIRKPLTCEQISRVLNRVWPYSKPSSMPFTVAYVRSYIEILHRTLALETPAFRAGRKARLSCVLGVNALNSLI